MFLAFICKFLICLSTFHPLLLSSSTSSHLFSCVYILQFEFLFFFLIITRPRPFFFFFFLNDPAPPEIYPLPYTTLFRSAGRISRSRPVFAADGHDGAQYGGRHHAGGAQGRDRLDPLQGRDRRGELRRRRVRRLDSLG